MRNLLLNVVVMLTVMAGPFAGAGEEQDLATRTQAKYGIGLARILKVNKLTCAEFSVLISLTTPPVRKPIANLLKLEIDEKLQANPLAKNGLLDVTGPPFGADNTGRKDSTVAIQQAINAARDNQMVCYFPLGLIKTQPTKSPKYCKTSNFTVDNQRLCLYVVPSCELTGRWVSVSGCV